MDVEEAPLRELAEQSKVVKQLKALVEYVSDGRKLTQAGRITLKDARALVELLDTGDVIDPMIGDRTFKTVSSEELGGLARIVTWAKAVGLVRVVHNRLVVVKKNASIVSRPDALWQRAFEVFPKLDQVICWGESVLLGEFDRVVPVVLAQAYGGPVELRRILDFSWAFATDRYAMYHLSSERLERAREHGDWETRRMLEALDHLGAIRLAGGYQQRLDRLPEPFPLPSLEQFESWKGARRAAVERGTVEATILGRWVIDAELGTVSPGDPVTQLRIELLGVERPRVWRRIVVPTSIPLDRLHHVIQGAMGWENRHLYVFTVDGQRYGPDPEQMLNFKDDTATSLAQVAPREGARLDYQYDFGDSWDHEILVERRFTAAPNVRYPTCPDGEGRCPPEDVGGFPGYEEFRSVLGNPKHEEHDRLAEWGGFASASEFDPAEFDLAERNRSTRSGWAWSWALPRARSYD